MSLRAGAVRIAPGAAAAALAALAFFLRVYRLADNNIWWDEGWTLWLSRHSFADIALITAPDEHPPLHYWLIHLFVPGSLAPVPAAFFGRFFSLFFGVLTVALLYRIGRRIGGPALGLLAALLLTLARFHVWWSQDIKNYTLSGFFALAAVWYVLLIVEKPISSMKIGFLKSPWLGYIVSITLALYSHYLAALIFLAANLFVLIVLLWQWRVGRRPLDLFLRWSIVQIVVLALFMPWFVFHLARSGTWTPAPAFDFGTFLQLAATVFALGVTTYIENYTVVVVLFTLLAALGTAWIVARGTPAPADVPLTSSDNPSPLALPSLRSSPSVPRDLRETHALPEGERRNKRFSGSASVLRLPLRLPPVAQSPLRMAAGTPQTPTMGEGARAEPRAGALFALVIVLIPPPLIYVLSLSPEVLFAPKIEARYLLILLPAYLLLLALGIHFLARRSRYSRPLALFALLLVCGAQVFTLNDYFQTRVLRDDYATLANVVNSFALPGDALVLNTDQEWPTFLYYLHRPMDWIGVPNGAAVDAAAARRVAAQAEPYHAVWLVTIPDALAKDPQHLVEAELAREWPKQYEQTFGDKRLTLFAPQVRNVKDVPSGNFSPQVALADEFDARLRLTGLDLPVREAQPGDTVRAVTYWQSADLADVRLALAGADGRVLAEQTVPISIGAHERAQADWVIPPGTPASELRVVASARLASFQIASLRVRPRAATESAAGAITIPLDYRLGSDIHLVGGDLPVREFRAGAGVPLTLFWKTDRPLATSYTVFAHLLGAQYNPSSGNFLWGQVDRLPAAGTLPTTAWAAGQVIADPYTIPIQAAPPAPPGLYKIEVGLYDAATGVRLSVFNADGSPAGDAVIIGQVEIK